MLLFVIFLAQTYLRDLKRFRDKFILNTLQIFTLSHAQYINENY